jgi:hypothetical protein
MFKFRIIPLLVASAFMVISAGLAACQKQSAQSRVQSYAQDGLLGITDVNPNMPMSPTYHTYKEDTRLMKETLAQVPYVLDSNILINGPIATVNIDVPHNLSEQEFAKVEKDAFDKLTNAMPRYTIKVFVYRK